MAAVNLRALASEIANLGNDPFHYTYMGILRPQEVIQHSDGTRNNYELFDKVENDCHAGAVLQKRKMAVIARPWRVTPGGKRAIDKQAAQEVEKQLRGLGFLANTEVVAQAPGFDQFTVNQLDAVNKGFSVNEIMWERRGNRVVAAEARPKGQDRFVFKALDGKQGGYELRMLTRNSLLEGEPVPPRKFVVFSYGSKIGNPYGLGLGLKLYWPVWFKRQGITFWLQFLERYASPTPVATYPLGTPQPERDKIIHALSLVSAGSPAIFPEGSIPTLLEANKSGSATEAYHSILSYLDEEISKAVLGETLTTNHKGVGSGQALGTVHNDVRTELTKADADLQCGCLNVTLARWITELNFPGAAIPIVDRVFEDALDQEKTANSWALLGPLGFKPTIQEVQRVFGEGFVEAPPTPPPAAAAAPGEKPKPGQPGAEITNAVATHPEDNGQQLGAEFADGTGPRREGPEKMEPWVDEVINAAAPALKGMVEEVRAIVSSAKSLEGLRDSLLNAFPDLDAAAFAEVMQKAIVVGNLAGRYEVLKGA